MNGDRTNEDHEDRINRVLDVVVYGPLGLGLLVRDLTPNVVRMLVARGRAEVDRRQEQVSQEVRHARGMGEVALAFGLPRLRKDVTARVDAARERVRGSRGRRGTEARSDPPAAPVAEAAGPAKGHGAEARAASAELPIPGYDALSASQVVERLAGLGSEDLEAVRAYESAHRNRRTILGKLDQLMA